MFRKIFNKKESFINQVAPEDQTVEVLEDMNTGETSHAEDIKPLSFYKNKKGELLDLYDKRAKVAADYHNQKEDVEDIGLDKNIEDAQITKIYESTLGDIDSKIRSLTQDGLKMTETEVYEKRIKLLLEEARRVDEKINDLKEQKIYPSSREAMKLLDLKGKIEEKGEEISDDERKSIISQLFEDGASDSLTNERLVVQIHRLLDDIVRKEVATDTRFGQDYNYLVNRKNTVNYLAAMSDSRLKDGK